MPDKDQARLRAIRHARRQVLREAIARLEQQAALERTSARALYEKRAQEVRTVEESIALTLDDDVAVAFERAADVLRDLLKE